MNIIFFSYTTVDLISISLLRSLAHHSPGSLNDYHWYLLLRWRLLYPYSPVDQLTDEERKTVELFDKALRVS